MKDFDHWLKDFESFKASTPEEFYQLYSCKFEPEITHKGAYINADGYWMVPCIRCGNDFEWPGTPEELKDADPNHSFFCNGSDRCIP